MNALIAGALGGIVAVMLLDLVVLLARIARVHRRRRNPLLRSLPR